MTGETAALARFTSALAFTDLPDDVVATAKLAIRDAVGVALFAARLEWSEIAAAHAVATSGAGPATVWGRAESLAPPAAALVNGCCVHGVEMDDRSAELDLHAGAAVVPAAWALVEARGGSGQDLLRAVVAGYEVAYRVARATKGAITPRFYGDSIRTICGAAAAAAAALGLDAERTGHALGVVGSMAGGLLEYRLDAHATMVKRLQGGGWPAFCGVTAAMLAARGLTGPATVLEGRHGLVRAFATEASPDVGALTAALGTGFEISAWETKPYAARGGYNSTIDAVTALLREHGVDPAAVDRMVIGCSTKIAPATHTAPRSVMAAQYDLRFVAAAAMFLDLRDPGVWSAEVVDDPRIVALLPRIHVEIDPEIERIYRTTNDHGGARVRLDLSDGRSLQRQVRHATGTPDNPMSPEELGGKFALLAGRAVRGERLAELTERLDALEKQPDLGALGRLMKIMV
ncbi:MmgE/PrpD family protein [Acrocarpospora catenulata]|uniref:MmgE/PrpD family protein n=1 Tax=Acrocarpospora catenulata TaxID=2836182 RepID=UPI001BD9D750|nr:MmgE/PrpD family protein [Acrocarpospora catenulata]